MKKRCRETATLDLTPLIDVVFLLLIFFMVSSVFKKEDLALMLQLPTSTSGTTSVPIKENFIIEMSEEQIAFNSKITTLKELAPLLAQIKNRESPIELRVDQNVRYQKLVTLLDLLKTHELTNLSLTSNKKN